MSGEQGRVLVLNPGTTSTKFGVYTRAGEEMARNIHHGDDEVARFRGRPMLDRLEYRAGLIAAALAEAGYSQSGKGEERWAAVAGRGGLLPPMECGTYLVEDTMVEELRRARRGEHASNLGAVLALRFASAAEVNAYIVDPVTVDEWQACARLSGSPLVRRSFIGHALNTKAVARRYARGQGRALCGFAADRGSHGQRGHGLGAPRRANDRQQLDRRGAVRPGSHRIAAGARADQAVL